MLIRCSWCLAEGKSGDMGEKPPLEDTSISHGICERHAAALHAEIARLKALQATPVTRAPE